MLKSEIFEQYEIDTKQTYKNQPLFVGDVYQNDLGTKSIILKENGNIILYKENGTKYSLPSQKAGFENSNFVANVVQDEELLNFWIEKGAIIDNEERPKEKPMTEEVKEVKEEKPKKKKAEKVEKVETVEINPRMSLLKKINNIRLAWASANIEKEGKGRAGGGAKYDYYKPQQIIDFCLKEETKNDLFSEFSVFMEECSYTVTDLATTETISVTCPFAIPKKMAASEAQQVGAAMTYHNRRLAMMMYKIEDNSKENVDVLENADYSKVETSAPVIPAPPIETKPPVSPIEPPKNPVVQTIKIETKTPITPNVVAKNDKKEEKKDDLPPWANVKPMPPKAYAEPPMAVPQSTPPVPPTAQVTNSIESLY